MAPFITNITVIFMFDYFCACDESPSIRVCSFNFRQFVSVSAVVTTDNGESVFDSKESTEKQFPHSIKAAGTEIINSYYVESDE